MFNLLVSQLLNSCSSKGYTACCPADPNCLGHNASASSWLGGSRPGAVPEWCPAGQTDDRGKSRLCSRQNEGDAIIVSGNLIFVVGLCSSALHTLCTMDLHSKTAF